MGSQLGVIGLAVMGENLALNIERNGFGVSVYNRTWEKTDAFLGGRGKGLKFTGAKTIPEFVKSLDRPRRILIMVKAGDPVDAVINELRPHLEGGDIVIDGGNSHYPDTDRRITALAPAGFRFVGMGVSGGEEGALWGPSMMPGGDRSVWEHLEPILTKIAAQADSGPCVTYIGAGSSGHFVKMVHNGIEYGDMQLISEAYDLLRHGLGLELQEIADVFSAWNETELESFLIEITAKILPFPDDGGRLADESNKDSLKPGKGHLLDKIVDAAGQKGTGKWTSEAALDFGVPTPTMTTAVDARTMSSMRDIRARAAKVYKSGIKPIASGKKAAIQQIGHALYAAKICSYAQGFDLLAKADRELKFGLDLGEIARIWKGGCIIRAVFLDKIRAAFKKDAALPNLLLDPAFSGDIKKRADDWRATVMMAMKAGITPPSMSSSLAYFDAFRRARLPANLIQAQRDFFGAHTYERLDKPGIFHSDWSALSEHALAAAGGNGKVPPKGKAGAKSGGDKRSHEKARARG
jgi:6-phosphogluconate dehydrogenase